MEGEYEDVPFYFKIQWPSAGKILKNFFFLRKKLLNFLQNKTEGWWILGEQKNSGGYWVRRVWQFPRTPLFKNTAYSFILQYRYIFFKDHYDCYKKWEISERIHLRTFFFRDHYEVGTKSGKYEINSKCMKTFFLENTNFWEF